MGERGHKGKTQKGNNSAASVTQLSTNGVLRLWLFPAPEPPHCFRHINFHRWLCARQPKHPPSPIRSTTDHTTAGKCCCQLCSMCFSTSSCLLPGAWRLSQAHCCRLKPCSRVALGVLRAQPPTTMLPPGRHNCKRQLPGNSSSSCATSTLCAWCCSRCAGVERSGRGRNDPQINSSQHMSARLPCCCQWSGLRITHGLRCTCAGLAT